LKGFVAAEILKRQANQEGKKELYYFGAAGLGVRLPCTRPDSTGVAHQATTSWSYRGQSPEASCPRHFTVWNAWAIEVDNSIEAPRKWRLSRALLRDHQVSAELDGY